MFTIEMISKSFRHRHEMVTALDRVSLTINDGEFLSITGPSGSGKSTLLLSLGGMSSPSTGKVYWDGEAIYDWTPDRRARWRGKTIGFVFQTFNLIPYLTVYDNIRLALDLAGSQQANQEQIHQMIGKMKLEKRAYHLPSELSVGQQQRVALARALIKDPKVILADEPTGNLDPNTASEIIEILTEANQAGKTVVLITHDPGLAKITRRNIQIVDGKLVE